MKRRMSAFRPFRGACFHVRIYNLFEVRTGVSEDTGMGARLTVIVGTTCFRFGIDGPWSFSSEIRGMRLAILTPYHRFHWLAKRQPFARESWPPRMLMWMGSTSTTDAHSASVPLRLYKNPARHA